MLLPPSGAVGGLRRTTGASAKWEKLSIRPPHPDFKEKDITALGQSQDAIAPPEQKTLGRIRARQRPYR